VTILLDIDKVHASADLLRIVQVVSDGPKE
jgi:hypothetical protein